MDVMAAKRKSGWGGTRQGAGRPRIYKNLVRRMINFEAAQDRLLCQFAEARGISISEVVRDAVRAHLWRQTRKK